MTEPQVPTTPVTWREKFARVRQRPIAALIDGLWFLPRRLSDLVAFLALRAYGIENVTVAQVRDGRYLRDAPDLELPSAGDLEGLLDGARDAAEAATARRAAVTDKCKVLLTLASALLAIVGLLLPKGWAFGFGWMKGVFFIAILCLLGTVVSLVRYFGVGNEMHLAITQDEVRLSKEDLQRSLINEHRKCQAAIDGRSDFLVDVYRVARACFFCALLIVGLLFGVDYWTRPAEAAAAKQLIRELRADPKLVELLRGPKGDRGEVGPAGPVGPRGGQGTPAPVGPEPDRGNAALRGPTSAPLGGIPWRRRPS